MSLYYWGVGDKQHFLSKTSSDKCPQELGSTSLDNTWFTFSNFDNIWKTYKYNENERG